MSKRHADSTPDEKASKRRKLSADSVLVEAARNGDTTAVRAGLEKLSPDTDSKTVAFDAVHEACRGNHDECLALLLPYVETTQMGFGMLLSECIHADHTACTEVLLQHWKSVCSNVAFVPHGHKVDNDSDTHRPCPAMWEDPAVCQVLIDAGADIETKDDMGRSPLHVSCGSGVLPVVKVLVEAGAEVRVTDNNGDTCLTLAAYLGHTETVRYLVGLREVDVNYKDNGSTALLAAADENHSDVVQLLIDAGADIEAKGGMGRSPLLWSCRSGALHVLKVLVEAGAEVRVTDDNGDTCLILASYFGRTETVRYLAGLPEVDVNHKGNAGYTALLAAAEKHPDVVQVLIDAGADVEVKDTVGRSPLHLACRSGALAAVNVLVKAGADVCVTDNKGDRCLMSAAHQGHTETVQYLVGLPEVDMNHSSTRGITSLHFAVLKKHFAVVQLLIDAGADIEAKDDEMSYRPLHCACEVGELEVVKMLNKAGADVCAIDFEGDVCLTVAADHGHTETVRYLVGLKDVNVNHRNLMGYTALHHARQEQRADVVEVLLKHGAEE